MRRLTPQGSTMNANKIVNKEPTTKNWTSEIIIWVKKIPITFWIFLANLLMYCYTAILSQNFIIIDIWVQEFFGVSGESIGAGRFFVFITAMFVHQDLLHLGLNLFSLAVIGIVFESREGRTNFLLIYFLAGLSTNVLSLILFPQWTFVGSSAAIFGIAGATIMRLLDSVIFGALFILALFAMAPPMSFLSHGIGAVVGVVTDYFLRKRTNRKTKYKQ
jgi:membrane associated rhomboid family serine protease